MSAYIQPQDYQLFIDLSQQDEEAVSGGRSSSYDFYIQKTDITTFANNENTLTDGNITYSSKQQTGYMSSQITIGFSSSSKRGRRSSRSNSSLLNTLFTILAILS